MVTTQSTISFNQTQKSKKPSRRDSFTIDIDDEPICPIADTTCPFGFAELKE